MDKSNLLVTGERTATISIQISIQYYSLIFIEKGTPLYNTYFSLHLNYLFSD